MTTNNHPAHGPVSLERLHQISEILSKAAAQSDGGNLGYAMADAVKVIDEVLEARNAEPVVLDEDPRDAFERSFKMPKHVTRCGTGYAVTEYSAWLAHDFIRMWEGWKACRAAMLQAGNSPVTPDGWIPVSERMPERDVDVQVYCADKKEQMVGYMERNEAEGWFRFASLPNGGGVYCKPTHWMPLPAAPQQEVKSALEHGMQRYAGAMQKLADAGD
ncbi:TPA: DUF551 domain-containing protein [Citrobacter freundii]